jgi:large subunit ribosomal protein L15
MLTLNNLKSPKGANKPTKRIGRGQASGQGTQAGKGHKGQKARKSGHVRIGFEGGSMPIFMRLPKKGFNNSDFENKFAEVTLSSIEQKLVGDVVSRETLSLQGLLKGINRSLPIKILGTTKSYTKKLKFIGIDAFTAGAKDLINKTGSSVE